MAAAKCRFCPVPVTTANAHCKPHSSACDVCDACYAARGKFTGGTTAPDLLAAEQKLRESIPGAW